MTKFAILGSGVVAKSLGAGLLKHGHHVVFGTRDAKNFEDFVKQHPTTAIHDTNHAAKEGEVIIIAVKWSGVHPLLKSLSEDHVKGKIILDVTNPIKEQKDQSFVGELLNLGDNNSGGEEVQKALPHSHVVKVWNSVGNSFMIDPPFQPSPSMPICGNEKSAKEFTSKLLTSVGWNPLDLGDIKACRFIEPICPFWCAVGMQTGNWANVVTVQTLKK